MTLKLGDIGAGDMVITDDAFTCIAPGMTSVVHHDDGSDELYIHCSHGRHYLNGQLNDDDEYVGLQRALSEEQL